MKTLLTFHLSAWAAAFLAIAHFAIAETIPSPTFSRSGPQATPPQAPDRLLMDFLSEPLAIESANPEMSWVVNDSSPGARQTAYSIRVTASEFHHCGQKP